MVRESSPLIAAEGYRACCCLRLQSRAIVLRITVLVIFLCHFTKEASNSVLPVILDPLSDASRNSDEETLLPGFQTASYAAGKLAQIPLAYVLGAVQTLILAFGCSTVGQLLFLVGGASVFTTKLGGIIIQSWGLALVWGAAGRVLVAWVDASQRGIATAVCTIGGDLSAAVASASYGAILDTEPRTEVGGTAWVYPPMISAALLGACFTAILLLMRPCPQAIGFAPPVSADLQAHPLDSASLSAALRCFLQSDHCWLTVLACCGYTCCDSFIRSYGPTYAIETFGSSYGEAARVNTCYNVGQALGCLTAGLTFDRLDPDAAINVTIVVKLAGMFAAVMFAVVDAYSGGSVRALYVIVFIIGIGIDFSWSVTVTLFAYRFGGPVHCATLMGVQDSMSFLFKIPCSFLFGELRSATGLYKAQIGIFVMAIIVAHGSILLYLILDRRKPAVPSIRKDDTSAAKKCIKEDALQVASDFNLPPQHSPICCIIS